MRLFRRVGSRNTDSSDAPSSQDPRLTAVRYDTQTTLPNDPIDNLNSKCNGNYKSCSQNDEDHIKHLQQIFNPPTSPSFSHFIARSVTNSPKISGMPKSKVASGKP